MSYLEQMNFKVLKVGKTFYFFVIGSYLNDSAFTAVNRDSKF